MLMNDNNHYNEEVLFDLINEKKSLKRTNNDQKFRIIASWGIEKEKN